MIDERVTGSRVIRTVLPAQAEAVAALPARARATYCPDGLPDDGFDRVGEPVLDVHVDNGRARAFYAHRGRVPDPENPPAEGDHHLVLRFDVPGE
ncbi:hypothetical protein ACIQ6R_08395 [Streptomyces sp. NPDC096048]|uniref:hypothetical protein n=1 Tax=Streptomyces sp. NPDC096048 TaxID=3366072 RepID=UPI00381F9152